MLAKKALYYHSKGNNCSQCLFKAYSDMYGVPLDKQINSAATLLNNGFGIGSICSVLVAAIIIIAIHFELPQSKTKRLLLLDKFHTRFKTFSCSALSKYDCTVIIAEVANILEELLN